MENNRRLAKTRPGMLTSSQADQLIFPFQAELDQAHVILLLERAERQNGSENRCGFDAHQDRRMHPLRHSNAIRCDDLQFERVLIDLGEQRRGRNGEHKRFRRRTRVVLSPNICSFLP